MAEAHPHLLLLVVSAGICYLSVRMARKPEIVLRFITLGGPMFGERFGIAFFRVVGWIFAVTFGLSVILQAILIPVSIFHR